MYTRDEAVRYIANGLFATAVHFSVLWVCLQVVLIPSAGLSNFLAACVGITVSYLGSRYFVFRATDSHIFGQATRFLLLYGAIALCHGAILLIWTDILGWDYRLGFLLATGLQVITSFIGNKLLVFNE